MDTDRISIRLLGRFEVAVNGRPTPERMWTRRSAASLVKILALAPGRRLHREQVMDQLWPDVAPIDAAPKLHKAAHFARKASGDDCVVLRNEVVMLFPSSELLIDVVEFTERSQRALADGDPSAAEAAIASYHGELLPDDRYEEWAGERRELLRLRHLHMLRLAGRFVELAELDPCVEVDGAPRTVVDLIDELAALNARQAAVLEALAGAGLSPRTAILAA